MIDHCSNHKDDKFFHLYLIIKYTLNLGQMKNAAWILRTSQSEFTET
jgi:hypothetical protein